MIRQASKIIVVIAASIALAGLGAGSATAAPHHISSGGATGCCTTII